MERRAGPQRRSSTVASGSDTSPWASIEDRNHRPDPRPPSSHCTSRAVHENGGEPLEGPEITFAEAVIDNGRFGTRTVRFETGRLAKQAAGAAGVFPGGESTAL